MDLDQLISELKSAVVIEDPSEIRKALTVDGRSRGSTLVSDDALKCVKRTRVAEPSDVESTAVVRSPRSEGAPETPRGDALLALLAQRGIPTGPDIEERVVPYWASDERVDSDGDIVRQAGISFARFATNPVLPYSHNWSAPPIGTGLDWKVVDRKSRGYKGPATWILGLFASDDAYPFAGSIRRLVKGGILRGGSIGFMPTRVIRIQDEAERQRIGLGRFGVVHDKCDLLEFSPTSIGANPGALAILGPAKAAGHLLADDVDVLRELARREITRGEGDSDRWRETDRLLCSKAETLFASDGRRWKEHQELDAPVVEVAPPEPEPVSIQAPAEEPATVDTLSKQIAALASTLDQVVSGLGVQVRDIRDAVESITADVAAMKLASGVETPTPDNDEPPHLDYLEVETTDPEALKRLEAALASLGAGGGTKGGSGGEDR